MYPENDLGSVSLSEHLYRTIRASILNGRFPPGSELRQEVLANQYGVSRVPLREALSRLQAEGLIQLRPRRGFAVTVLDMMEIMEVFELRMVVEQHAMEVAARMRSEHDLREVGALLDEMERLSPAEDDYLDRWLTLNHRFHDRLIASTGRDRLVDVVSNLRDATEPYVRLEANATGQVDDAAGEHRDIFEAFKARDSARAGQVVRDHALGTMKRLMDGMRLRQSEDKKRTGARSSPKKMVEPR